MWDKKGIWSSTVIKKKDYKIHVTFERWLQKNWEVFTTEKVPLVTFLNMSNALPIYLLQRDKIVFF